MQKIIADGIMYSKIIKRSGKIYLFDFTYSLQKVSDQNSSKLS